MKFSILAVMVVAAMAFAMGCDRQAETDAEQKPAVADETPKPPTAFDEKPAVGTKAFCPVMKNEFVVSEGTDFSEHEGKHYGFCCSGCKPQFDADPEKFTGG